MNRLENKVAIITGGARGIGAATAHLFVEEGARVVVTDVLDGTAFANSLGSNAIYVPHDVASTRDWQSVIAKAEAAFGPVSVLVNNAGIVGAQLPVDEYSEDEYRRVIDVNQYGVFFGMKFVVPSMRRVGGGSIVNVSSIAGLVATPGIVAYAASKFAVTGMTKAAALDLGKDHIRVNSVHPGLTRTPLLEGPEGGVDESRRKSIASSLALGRVAEASEIASVILFLASEESSYCTGATFSADAGWTAA